MTNSHAADFAKTPFWWIAAPRPPIADAQLPARADVVIVGSGVTGLNAARELARGGRDVVVLDRGEAGIGATSRNAGHIGRVLKHEFTQLVSGLGLAKAIEIYREMQAAYDAVGEVTKSEGIDCEYRVSGRVILAYTPKQLEMVEAECAAKKTHLGEDYTMLDRAGLKAELDSPLFVGGAYLPESASLHPGLYHLGLLAAAKKAGVNVLPGTDVQSIDNIGTADAQRFRVSARRADRNRRARRDRGDQRLHGARHSRAGSAAALVPFDAFMIASEELSPEAMRAILPGNRVYIDANRNVNFFRQSPDGKRVLYGGRTGGRPPADLATIGEKLFADARKILPGLEGRKLGRVWTGALCGYDRSLSAYRHAGRYPFRRRLLLRGHSDGHLSGPQARLGHARPAGRRDRVSASARCRATRSIGAIPGSCRST